jgi:hypothetical protein
LWKVTRSTKPASTSWVDGSCCGLICVATVGASPPNRIWRPALRSRSSSATRAPRVLSIGDRSLVGNRPAIQILGSLEAACDDGAVAAVELITLGRPADSFGLSERCLLGAASSSCRRARCTFGPRYRSARRAERKRDHSDQGGWQRRGSIGLRGGQPVRTILSPPPSHRYRTQFSFFALVPPEWGPFESLRVSVSVSKRRNGGFYAPVSASKISVPDSDVRDRFDDWVGGWQFGRAIPSPLAPPALLSWP